MTCATTPMTDTSSSASGQSLIRRRKNFLTALLLAVMAWIFYLPSTQYGFVDFDDVRILKNHPELYGQPHLAADLKAIFVTCFPREEPLLARDEPGRSTATYSVLIIHSVIISAMCCSMESWSRCCLSFYWDNPGLWLCPGHRRCLSAARGAYGTGRMDHGPQGYPVRAVPVAGAVAQTQRLGAEGLTARCGWYAATLAFFVVGLLSKISALTFPLGAFSSCHISAVAARRTSAGCAVFMGTRTGTGSIIAGPRPCRKRHHLPVVSANTGTNGPV